MRNKIRDLLTRIDQQQKSAQHTIVEENIGCNTMSIFSQNYYKLEAQNKVNIYSLLPKVFAKSKILKSNMRVFLYLNLPMEDVI